MPLFNDDTSVIFPGHPGFASQKYYCYPSFAATGSISCSANFVYYSYIFVPFQTTFDRAAFFSNTTFTAGQNQKARLAIYKISETRPLSLIADLGEIALTISGIKEIACSVSLTPGWYALAINVSPNTMTSQYASNNICNIFGQSTPNTGLFTGHRAALTYGAFPVNASLVSIAETTSPIIWLRAA